MDEAEIKPKVAQIFAKVLANVSADNFDFSKPQAQFENWDSFTHLELISEIEKVFSISLNVDESTAIQNPQDVVSLIMKKKGVE
ncbi:MAG: acyl carrier protein [Candidatus Micrarchaeota archaeon]